MSLSSVPGDLCLVAQSGCVDIVRVLRITKIKQNSLSNKEFRNFFYIYVIFGELGFNL